MRVAVSPDRVELLDPAVFTAFHVEAPADLSAEELDACLRRHGAGELAEEAGSLAREGRVFVEWVRANAPNAGQPGWDAPFAAMLAYAADKGWLDADGTAISAHVETV